jgi:hypothetical protein
MVDHSSNFAGKAFGLRTCATSGPSNYEEDAQGKANTELGPAPLEIPLQHRTALFRALLYRACGRTIGLVWADIWVIALEYWYVQCLGSIQVTYSLQDVSPFPI